MYLYALIILVPFTFWTFLFRYFFAAAFLLNGAYRWFLLNDKKGLLLISTSVLVHVSFLPFILLCWVARSKFFKFHYLWVVLLFLLAIVCDTSSIGVKLLSLMPFSDSLVMHIYEYIDGSQSESITKQYSLLQTMILYLSNAISLYVFYVYVRMYRTNYHPSMNLVNAMLLLLFVSASFPVIFGRFQVITSFFINGCILIAYKPLPQIRKYLRTVCYATLLLFIVACWQRRFFLSYGFEYKILTSSFYGIASFSYSDEWVNNNINEDGDFYKWLDR